MKGYFNSIDDVFSLLNSTNTRYLVLRNFEELENENIFVQGHPDIDLLCEDSMTVVRLLGAHSCRKTTSKHYGDGTHYYIYINKKYVSLDLRHIGDDYYCKKWEEDILASREPHMNYYVPSKEHLFYSLIYHAIFQKKKFSSEYNRRLNLMKNNLGFSSSTYKESDFVLLLEKYMQKNSYRYVYPADSCVPLMEKWHDKQLVFLSLRNYLPHCLFHAKVAIIELLVNLKHHILK